MPKSEGTGSHKKVRRAGKKERKKKKKLRKAADAIEGLGHMESMHSELTSAAPSKLNRKQKEVARIYQLKCSILMRHELPFLEYVELREEIARLSALLESMGCKAASIEKQ